MSDRGFLHDVHVHKDGDELTTIEVYRCEEEDGNVEGLGPRIAYHLDATTLPGYPGDDEIDTDCWYFFETDIDLPDWALYWVADRVAESYDTPEYREHYARWVDGTFTVTEYDEYDLPAEDDE